MGPQRAPAKDQAADLPDGFGVAVVREDGKWRCSADASRRADQPDGGRNRAA